MSEAVVRHEPRSQDPSPGSPWEAIDAFKNLLRDNPSGAAIRTALPFFARDQIYPHIRGVTSFADLEEGLSFFRSHLAHSVRDNDHPSWAAEAYPIKVIEVAEDILLDTEIYPRINPAGPARERNVTFANLNRFPVIISDYLKLRVGLTDEESRQKDAAAKEAFEELVRENVAPITSGIGSAAEYRHRLELLRKELSGETEEFNKQASSVNSVRSDFESSWTDQFIASLRKQYFTSLFDQVYRGVKPPARGVSNRFLGGILGKVMGRSGK